MLGSDSQSHQTGIETQDLSSTNTTNGTPNRTMLELKQHRRHRIASSPPPNNRTMLELKLDPVINQKFRLIYLSFK